MKDQGKIKYFLGREFTYDNIIYMLLKIVPSKFTGKIRYEGV